MLPTTYFLQEELIRVGNVHCYGGSANIGEGEYLGRRVAIKCLRIGTKDAFDKIFKVLDLRSTQ